jgi:hypothetical protein
MQTLTELLDVFKTLPAGADPTPWYTQYSLKPEDMAVVRRWVNSPSIGEEETLHIKDGGNQTVEQTVEMKVSAVVMSDNAFLSSWLRGAGADGLGYLGRGKGHGRAKQALDKIEALDNTVQYQCILTHIMPGLYVVKLLN